MAVFNADQQERELAEQQQFELQRRQREEERLRLDEEARQREQQALEQLQRQEQVFQWHHVNMHPVACDRLVDETLSSVSVYFSPPVLLHCWVSIRKAI